MQLHCEQCSAANPQRGAELSFAFYIPRHAAVLRASLACSCCSGSGQRLRRCSRQAPWLVTMSHHKHWVFIVAGLLISANFVYLYAVAPKLQARSGACDPSDPAACQTASRFSRMVLWCSAALYLVGCFTAYLLGPILVRFDS